MDNEAERVLRLKEKFMNKISILKKSKDSILRLFKNKLEERKIEEIKNEIINNSK